MGEDLDGGPGTAPDAGAPLDQPLVALDASADAGTDGGSDAAPDANPDAGGDADGDTDGDADTDADTDADGDTDADSDTDVDTDTGTATGKVPHDGGPDAGGDTDTDTDTDGDGDADTDADTDSGTAYPCGVPAPDGTWCDPATGLLWQVAPLPDAALGAAWSACDALELGGLTDWHLPTVTDGRTLVRDCPQLEPGGLCEAPFDFTWCSGSNCWTSPPPSGCFWPDAMGTDCHAWAWLSGAAIDYGQPRLEGAINPDTPMAVRCVRPTQ